MIYMWHPHTYLTLLQLIILVHQRHGKPNKAPLEALYRQISYTVSCVLRDTFREAL